MNYEPSEVLIHTREPFNKNTVWIQPTNGELRINLYISGKWVPIYTTKDNGLSNESLRQILDLINQLKSEIETKLTKQFNKQNSDSLRIFDKLKNYESRIVELEDKFNKLSNKYSALLLKLHQNGN